MVSDFFMSLINYSSDKEATIVMARSCMFSTMVDYSERLVWAMKQSSCSVRTLAAALGASYQAVKKVVDGKSSAFNAFNNSRAAKILGVSSDWLATGDGLPKASESTSSWPFASVPQSRVEALPAEARAAVEADLRHAVEREEGRLGKGKGRGRNGGKSAA